MNDNFTNVLLSVAGAGIIGFVAWTVKSIAHLRADHDAYRLHVAEQYIKKDDLDDVKKELRGLRDLTIEIAGKLGIPVRS
ncbi:hypothetical protein ISN75_06895 [Dyella marensis]|uniref:hypothetical protein n=1 Tax=Dyella marensis TaxID=500610 RepID=UPI0031DE631D